MNTEGDGFRFAGTLRRLGGDRGLFHDLAEFYRQDSPLLLEEMRDGLKAGDIERVQRAAHRLRSMLENFDMERAVAITRTIEQTCRRGELPLVPEALIQLQDDMEALDLALRNVSDAWHEGASRNGGGPQAVHAVHHSR